MPAFRLGSSLMAKKIRTFIAAEVSEEVRAQTERIGAEPIILHPRRRSAPWWTLGRIAAGIALMIATGSYVYNSRTSTNGGGLTTTEVIHPPPSPEPARATMVLTGASEKQYISVRRKTSSPNVHIFRLYRAYKRPDSETSDS